MVVGLKRPVPVAALLLGLLCAMPPTVLAAEEADDWSRQKCALYSSAWERALEWRGTEGLSERFLARHEAFLAGGCLGRGDVCPQSPQELALADLLTIAAMNEGMASTFLPFACQN